MRRSIMRAAVLGLASVVAVAGLTVASDAASTSTTTTAAGPSCGGERPVDPTGGSYVCTFTEDFDGSTYDTSKWLAQDTSFSGMTTAEAGCYQASDQTVSVGGGSAHISARRTATPFTCRSPFGDFTSHTLVGTLTTATHFSQAYGRFEFRARFPKSSVTGAHSALWLYPAAPTYGAWPNSGEIDVAEWYSSAPTYVLPSAHYAGEVPFQSTGLTCRTGTANSFHTYAVDWTPTTMYFSMDGKVCWQHSWLTQTALPGSAPFDQPFYIVLTQVFEPVSAATATSTSDVATTDVDWVRAWKSTPKQQSSSLRQPKLGKAVRVVRARRG